MNSFGYGHSHDDSYHAATDPSSFVQASGSSTVDNNNNNNNNNNNKKELAKPTYCSGARVQKPAPQFTSDAVVNGEFKTVSLSDFRGTQFIFLSFYLFYLSICISIPLIQLLLLTPLYFIHIFEANIWYCSFILWTLPSYALRKLLVSY